MHNVLRRTATVLGTGALAVSAFALTPGSAHAALPLSSNASAVSATAATSTTTALKYTIPSGTTSLLRLVGVGSLSGTVTVAYTATGAVKAPGARRPLSPSRR